MKHKELADLPQKAQKALKLRFKDRRLLLSALYHPSARDNIPPKALHDFDRLEFFGDSILNFVICIRLYSQFSKGSEGVLSRLRSILVSRKILSRVAKDLKLHQTIQLPKHIASQSLETKAKILADSLEALIAAIYLDQGINAAQKFILKHFRPYLNAQRLLRLDPNPKSTLQELSQKRWQILPVYEHKPVEGSFKVTVSIGRSRKATAVGRTHRDGEQKAARNLIRKIRQETPPRSRRNRVSSGKKLRKTL